MNLEPEFISLIKNCVKKNFPRAKIFIFGSRAKENNRKFSDIDIAIKDLKIISGELPPRVYSLVAEWALIHQSDLINDWQKVKNLQNPTKIKPLV